MTPIQSKSKAPIFWVNAGIVFRDLAANLGPARPFIGVTLGPAERDALRENCTLEEIARQVVHALLAEKPRAPFHLAGFCASGIVAYEAAVQLQALGHKVGSLILLESPEPGYYRRRLSRRSVVWPSMLRYTRKILSLNPPGASKYRAKSIATLRPFTELEFDQKMSAAARRYTPRRFGGTLTVIQATNRPAIADLGVAWRGAPVSRLVVHSVSGDFYVHQATHDAENVRELADCINGCLERAELHHGDAVMQNSGT